MYYYYYYYCIIHYVAQTTYKGGLEESDLNASWVHSNMYSQLSTCDRITQDAC